MSSRKELLDYGVDWSEWAHVDGDGKLIINLQEDCEPIIEGAKRLSELEPGKEFRHVAVIPRFVLDRSFREQWDAADWKRWANDRDNRLFRTWPGRL